MTFKHVRGLAILPGLLLALACSGGDPISDTSPSGNVESIGEVSAELGESSCGYAGANIGYTHSGFIPEPGLVTPANYSNAKCYKAWVTEVANWRTAHQEWVVADASIDSASWHAASAQPSPAPQSSAPSFQLGQGSSKDPVIGQPGPFPIVSEAACTSLSLKATLYKDGKPLSTRSARGEWVSLSLGAGYCKKPWVRFGGMSAMRDGFDPLFQGHEYKIAASLRPNASTSAPTLPLKILTPVVPCGVLGGACCPAEAATGACDGSRHESCQADTCLGCGLAGQPPCPFGNGDPGICQDPTNLTVVGGICTPCGGQNQLCCPPENYLTDGCGFSAPYCVAGRCQKEKAQPPKPTWDPQCGQQFHQCCPRESGIYVACQGALACINPKGGFLGAYDPDLGTGVCDAAPQNQDPCQIYATAVIDSCGGGNDILPGATAEGCGTTLQGAQVGALLSFGFSNICLDNDDEDCCSYHFE